MKLAMVIFLSKMLADRQGQITTFAKGLLPPLSIMGAAFGLIMLQPDLGTGTVMVGASLLVIFTAGARLAHLARSPCLALPDSLVLCLPRRTGCSGLPPFLIRGRTRWAQDISQYNPCMRLAREAGRTWTWHEPAKV